MYSKFIPRLLHYIDLGDLEKITWCLQKDEIDLNEVYEYPDGSDSINILSYVILNEYKIPQSEEILELLIQHGGDLYSNNNSGYKEEKVSPWIAHLKSRAQKEQAKRVIRYDENGFIHHLFEKYPSPVFWNIQAACQEAGKRFDIEMLEMVLNIGADLTKSYKENATVPIIDNISYYFDLEKRKKYGNLPYISDETILLAEKGRTLLEQKKLQQSLPQAQSLKNQPRI